MLTGQEEPEGNVARAAETKPRHSFLFAKGELCLCVREGLLCPHSFKVLQHFKDENEEILSSAQTQTLRLIISSVEGRGLRAGGSKRKRERAGWEKSKL